MDLFEEGGGRTPPPTAVMRIKRRCVRSGCWTAVHAEASIALCCAGHRRSKLQKAGSHCHGDPRHGPHGIPERALNVTNGAPCSGERLRGFDTGFSKGPEAIAPMRKPFNQGGAQANTQIQLLQLRGEGLERVFEGKGGPITRPGGAPPPTWTLQDRTQKAAITRDLGKWQV